MNSYERVMAIIEGRKADCVPRIPILMHFAARYITASYGDFCRDHNVKVRANRKLVDDFGFDQLDVMSDPWTETTAFGGAIEYLDDAVPRCGQPLESSKEIALLDKPDPAHSARMAYTLRTIASYREFGWKTYSITGWVEGPAAEASDLRGVSRFMIDLIDDEPFARDLMDLCTNVAVDFARAQIGAGADTIGVGDAVVSQISPAMYERLVAPFQKRLFDRIHEAGGLVRLHICGDINAHLPIIAGLGVDIVDCDSMIDMKKARKILGQAVVLTGNLDPVNAVMKSTPDKIRRDLRALYETVGDPWFVNGGCEIPAGTPHENLRALCEPIPIL